MTRAEGIVMGIIRIRKRLIALLLVVSGLALLGALRVGVDNSVEIWFPADDPALKQYHGFLNTFGNDEVVVIGIHSPDGSILDEGHLERIGQVSDAALEVDGIAKVRSIVTEPLIRGDPNTLEISSIMNTEEALAAVGRDPLAQSLVSADMKTAVILAEMEAMSNIDSRRDGILRHLKQAVKAVDAHASFAGIGVVYAALNQASTVDAALVIVASYVLILVMLRLFMGRWRSTFVTLGVVALGAIWLMGLYGASGRNINMVTMVMPTLVLVIGVSDCVHMLVHVASQPADLPSVERVKRGVGAVLWPCLFNTLTTAMGFLALSTASMPVIRDLGIFCALGLVAAFVGSLLICSIFAVMPSTLPRVDLTGNVQRIVDACASMAVHHPVRILAFAGCVVLVSAMGVTRIEVDTYSIDFLHEDHAARVDSSRLEEGFGPYTPLEFVVHSDSGVKSPEVLRSIARWQQSMESDPRVGWTRSIADVVLNLDRVLSGRERGQIPTDHASIEQLLFLYDSDVDSELMRFIDETDNSARVTVGVPMGSAKQFGTVIDDLLHLTDMPEGIEIAPAGYIPLYVRIMEHIVSSQLSSFALAFVVIFTLIGVLFRSVRMAVLAVPSNLLPVFITLGCMGGLGIRLDVATVTIAAIVLGLVVDDTTQFLYRYRQMQIKHEQVAVAVMETVRTVGRPLLITTVVLAGGFSVLGLAAIKSVAYFGLLLCIALISALFSDLLVIPALLMVSERR